MITIDGLQDTRTFVYIRTAHQLQTAMTDILSASLLGVDTEFTDLDVYSSRLLLVSLATDDYRYVIDCEDIGAREALHILKPALESETILKIGHNLTAEFKQFWHHGGVHMHCMWDTLIADQIINAGLLMPFGLKDVVLRRLGIDLDKEIRMEFVGWERGKQFSHEQLEYSAYDAVYPILLYHQQHAEITANDQLQVVAVDMGNIAPAAMMEYTGAPIDVDALKEMEAPFNRFIQQADSAFQDIIISSGAAEDILFTPTGWYAVNSGSSAQVSAALQRAGIVIKDKTGKITMDSKSVQRWDLKNSKRDKHEYIDYYTLIDDPEVAEALDNYKLLHNKVLRAYAFLNAARKLLSTYILGLQKAINPHTGRIHPTFRVVGAHRTGRYSSSGPNFQNLPNDSKLQLLGLGEYSIRRAIRPKEGRSVLVADYSGVELVILAALSGDTELMHQIFEGDIHTFVAQRVLGYADINADNKDEQPHKSWRQAAKRVSFSNAYGSGGSNLSDQMNVDLAMVGIKYTADDGDMFIQRWFDTFPQTAAYLQENARKAVDDLYVAGVWGRRRNWSQRALYVDGTTRDRYWKRLAAEREGKNAPIQGASATMTKRAIQLIWERLDPKRARLIITVHDELVVESTDSYIEAASQVIKESMEQALAEVLPIIADSVGKYKSLTVKVNVSKCYDK